MDDKLDRKRGYRYNDVMGLSRFRQEYFVLSGKSEVHVTYKTEITGNKLKNVFSGAFAPVYA